MAKIRSASESDAAAIGQLYANLAPNLRISETPPNLARRLELYLSMGLDMIVMKRPGGVGQG